MGPMNDLATILDLERWPLDRPGGGAWSAAVARCREALAAEGMAMLAGFLRPEAVRRAVCELAPLIETDSFHQSREHNIYFSPEAPGAPGGHPALAPQVTASRTVCDDRMAGAVVHAVYEWPPLAAFLAAVMGRPRLFPMADPLARANVMAYRAGEGLGWHFDRSEFTVTLVLQAPEAGGVFEYRTGLRSDDNPNLDGVARLLAGRDPAVRARRPAPGALHVFRGRNTAHRVTPVEGSRQRMVAVFSWFERPGVTFGAEERLGFYGRAA